VGGAELAHATADHDSSDVAGEHQEPNGGGHCSCEDVPDAHRVRIACLRGIEELGRGRTPVPARPGNIKGCPGGVLLQAPPLSTRTCQAGGHHRDVAELPGRAVGTSPHDTVEHQACGDSLAGVEPPPQRY